MKVFSAVASAVALSVATEASTGVARCHVYYVGDTGACGTVATAQDQNGGCGTSASDPCISTTDAGMCPSSNSKCNCGTCYKLTMTYTDGTKTTTFIKSGDTSGSDAMFEMSQVSWTMLCPYVCQGYGNCVHDKAVCPYGVIADQGEMPGSCNVQSAQVEYEEVDCSGGGGGGGGNPTQAPTNSPYNPTQAPTNSPYNPTQAPTKAPYNPTQAPTYAPYNPTQAPTYAPYNPTQAPTYAPYNPTQAPTNAPYNPTQAPPSGGGCHGYTKTSNPVGYCQDNINTNCVSHCQEDATYHPDCASDGKRLLDCVTQLHNGCREEEKCM